MCLLIGHAEKKYRKKQEENQHDTWYRIKLADNLSDQFLCDFLSHSFDTIEGFGSGGHNLIGRQLESVTACVTQLEGVRVSDAHRVVGVIGSAARRHI